MAASGVQNGVGGFVASVWRFISDRAALAVVQVDGNGAPLEMVSSQSSTGTQSNVASANTATPILAANANRRGAMIYNDDANALLLLLSATGTVSAALYSVSVAPNSAFTVPFGYTGAISGIWTADGSGSARVTEFT